MMAPRPSRNAGCGRGDKPVGAAIPLVIYGALATGLAVAYAAHIDSGDSVDGIKENNSLKVVRGAAYGLACVWSLNF